MARTYESVVSDNQRKDQKVLDLRSKTKRYNHALKVVQDPRTSAGEIVKVVRELLAA